MCLLLPLVPIACFVNIIRTNEAYRNIIKLLQNQQIDELVHFGSPKAGIHILSKEWNHCLFRIKQVLFYNELKDSLNVIIIVNLTSIHRGYHQQIYFECYCENEHDLISKSFFRSGSYAPITVSRSLRVTSLNGDSSAAVCYFTHSSFKTLNSLGFFIAFLRISLA